MIYIYVINKSFKIVKIIQGLRIRSKDEIDFLDNRGYTVLEK